MKYRVNQRTGDRISEIGIGTAYICDTPEEEAVRALRFAFENGINFFDLATSHSRTFDFFRKALGDVRNQVFYQIHFGADYSKGDYGWSLRLEDVKRSISQTLEALGTDYIDYGFIHCQDDLADWETFKRNGILDHLLELKEAGVVRHLGLGSHTPSVLQKILDEVPIDLLMFSINPGYDYHHGDFAKGTVDERTAVYSRCKAEGIGISVMKPFSGGRLLDAKLSPFGVALTEYQCMRYALDTPSVLTLLPGIRSRQDVEKLLDYYEQPEEALDYSVIRSFSPEEAMGKCVYCGHCKPCPAGLDIDLINKYYDLARTGDEMAVEHYRKLEKHAADCIGCGHCDRRCPFHVEQSARMKEIADYFTF